MIRTTSVCEIKDSVNHAVWNTDGNIFGSIEDWKTNSIVKKVTKSKRELTGPKVTIKRLMKEISHLFGFSMYSGSTLSVVITVWDVS